ncbi:MAG TPA: hypothetical protein VFS67_28915 [Polyangiaceae bacterium]|nr:hypothetical protein [Polyangiaceae bacterium]
MRLLSVARRSMAVACCLSGVWAWERTAAACSRPAPIEFALDPAQRALDSVAPSAPLHVSGIAGRYSGSFCDRDECTVSSCGSAGFVQLEFEPAQDARSSVLGYRLRLRSGAVPEALWAKLGGITAARSSFRIDLLPFDEIAALDASFTLAAIDSAGNESAPSEPFHLAFNGCTELVNHSGCAEDLPGVTCEAGECTSAEGPLGPDAEGCALSLPGASDRSSPLIGLCVAAGALAALRRRR